MLKDIQKMNDVKRRLNIADAALRRIKKYCGKKKQQKTLQKKKKNIKHFLNVKMVFLLLKNLHVI